MLSRPDLRGLEDLVGLNLDPDITRFHAPAWERETIITIPNAMTYTIELKPQAVKNLKKLPPPVTKRILAGLDRLADNLTGDVKRLTHFTPEYRLRIGDYRVLFEIVQHTVIVYRILHRKESYNRRLS